MAYRQFMARFPAEIAHIKRSDLPETLKERKRAQNDEHASFLNARSPFRLSPTKNQRPGIERKPEPQTLMEEATVKTTVLFPLTLAASRSAAGEGQDGILASRADAEEVIVC